MATRSKSSAASPKLPSRLRSFFWDYDFADLTWEQDQDFIIRRVLAVGDWPAVQWLRACLGDEALRDWITRRQGAGLSPPQLRFWEAILGLPHRQVSAWLAAPGRQPWDRRRQR